MNHSSNKTYWAPEALNHETCNFESLDQIKLNKLYMLI